MSSLGYCNLDEAFNTSSKLKKKGKKYSKIPTDDDTMDKILGRSKEVEIGVLPGEPRPNLSTNSEYVRSISDTYDQNSLFLKEKDKESLTRQKAKDQEPNEWQKEQNNESKKIFEEIQLQIFNLTKEIKELKNTPKEKALTEKVILDQDMEII